MNKRPVNKYAIKRDIFVFSGIALNFVLALLMHVFDVPLYLDTIGTIIMAALGGYFHGILVAVATNVLCGLFNSASVYYSLLNAFVAILTAYFSRKKYFNSKFKMVGFALIIASVCGIVGGAIQWGLMGKPQFTAIGDMATYLSESTGISSFACFLFANLCLNIVDKGLTTAAAYFLFKAIPEDLRRGIKNSGWQQAPLAGEAKAEAKGQGIKNAKSLRMRMSVLIVAVAVSLTVLLSWISMKLFYDHEKEEHTEIAYNAVKLAAEVIDGDKVAEFFEKGRSDPEYLETEKLLYAIRDKSPGVAYLYANQIRDDGCYFLFDLESEDAETYKVGEKAEFEEAFYPLLPAMRAGEEISPVESDDITGWLLTVYYPVKDSTGRCVCYAGADVQMEYFSSYATRFILRTLLIFSGFFCVAIGYGLWMSGYSLVYPINTMATCANSFAYDSSQVNLDENVDKIKKLEIKTGDEIENLYEALCRVTVNTAEQVKDLKHQSKMITQMQTGLIITMADMVETRDSDTGAHVQKTAAYVRIILEGLRRKGYYTEKLTDKYINDVEMSAPLHDVGKINISDTILNKPGKLTDEEYEIMKTHTTAGKKIMEKAISTVRGESYLKEARNMAAYHHEKWNGTGYPDGLYGEVIPLSARVMAVADVFDALTSKRVYKDAMPLEQALEIIQKDAGTHFDPKCVEAFVDSLDEVKYVLKKYQNS